jgi:hypothetical protein
MVDKLVLGLVITCTLTMCSDKPKTTEQTENEVTEVEGFKSVYDTLDQMEIPITFRPDEWSDLYMKHLDKYGVKEGWELMKHPYAKLVDSKNYKAIIFISTDETGSPTLITIDRIGNPIDTLFLLGDWASNDPSNGTTEIATINKDLTIHLLDSASTYDLGPDGDRIESTRKLTVTDELYRILNSGVIEKIR